MISNYGYHNKKQVQGQLNNQKLMQLQDQEFSFNIMCILLNSLEGYALENGGKRKYAAYDHFNSVKLKDKMQLKKQLIYHLRRMKESYELYTQTYGSYDFPKNMPLNMIISDVNSWMQKVPQEDKKYYSAFINLLNGQQIPSFKEDYSSIPSNAQPGLNYGYNFMEGMAKISYQADQKSKKVQEEYKNKGHYECEPNFYGKPHSDPFFNKMENDLNRKAKPNYYQQKYDYK